MLDTVFTQVNALGSNQTELLVFTDRHGRPISDVKVPGVDLLDADHIEIPGLDPLYVDNIEIPGVNMDIQDPQVIRVVYPNIPSTDPAYIELAPVHQVAAAVEPMPSIQQVEPKLRRSSRIGTQMEKYTPSMSGPKYSYSVTQL